MQMFENLPWYGYLILAAGVIGYAYKYFMKAKEGHDEASLKNANFTKASQGGVSDGQQFALALYTPIAEWYGAATNTLNFVDQKTALKFLQRWHMDSKEGYWGLTEYFMKDGRRWYFDFIYNMINTQPQENWNALMKDYFGDNDRAFKYLKLLKNDKLLNTLKQKGFLTFDKEMDLGIAGYDAALLAGHARKAYTANIISEEEAWKVIKFAQELALEHFSSWEQFGKSFILGFAFDQQHREVSYREEVYHMFEQTLQSPESPWNTIDWPK